MAHKDYLEELAEFREMLRWLLNKELLQELVSLAEAIDRSYVMNYKELKEKSEHGENCGYAARAKELFLAFKERDISAKIESLYKTYVEER